MNFNRLKELIPNQDIDVLWSVFRKTNPDADTSTFTADLCRKGMLTQAQLRDLLTDGDVSFTISEAISTQRGVATSSYRLLGLLGKGAMGEVHIARDTELNRNVAVKLMDPGLANDPVLRRRFLTEVQVTAQLDHPAVVPVYGIERRPDGTIGYSMRIVRGHTLERFIKDCKSYYERGDKPDEQHDLKARLLLFQELCNALHYAHSRGVIHRDLKPENIMIGSYGEVMVMDWGIARLMGGGDDPTTGMPIGAGGTSDTTAGTQFGTAIGTPPYMSPEQAQGRNSELDGKSDQYSLGLILYELVALKRAVSGKKVIEVITRAASGYKHPLVHAFNEAIPRELGAIIDKATAPNPDNRYVDVDAFANDVRRFLRDESVEAAPDRGLARVTRWISRHRQATLGAVVGLLGLVFFVGLVSIGLGLTAVGVQQYYAQVREERLADVIGKANDQAHQMDSAFQRYGAMLAGLAAVSEQTLQIEPTETYEIYSPADFHGGTHQPADLRDSKVYEGPASIDFPDTAVSPVVDQVAVDRRLQQLSRLQPHMQRMLLRSHSEDSVDLVGDARRKLLLDEGVPMVWAYIAVAEGALLGLPGTGEYPDAYDSRQQAWYKRTVGTRGLVWDANEDESGQGLLVTISQALYDNQGQFLGVAALDISPAYITSSLLVPPSLPTIDAALIDENGLLIAGSSVAIDSKQKPAYRHQEVTTAVKSGKKSGQLELTGLDGRRELVVWTQLDVVPWTYVIAGPASELLGG